MVSWVYLVLWIPSEVVEWVVLTYFGWLEVNLFIQKKEKITDQLNLCYKQAMLMEKPLVDVLFNVIVVKSIAFQNFGLVINY